MDEYGHNLRHFHDADIKINRIDLSEGQVAAVRVAILSFTAELQDPDHLGEDDHGRNMVRLYRARLMEVIHIMQRKANAPS